MIGWGLYLDAVTNVPTDFPNSAVNRHQASVRELEETHHKLTKPPQGYARVESMAHVCDRFGLGILQKLQGVYTAYLYIHSQVIRCNKAPRTSSSSDASCVLPMHHGQWLLETFTSCRMLRDVMTWWGEKVFQGVLFQCPFRRRCPIWIRTGGVCLKCLFLKIFHPLHSSIS